ncbi:MAG: flagellar biosynthetic protein FliR [Verrucomicrobiia bacterium]|jgi:flagellar biosynthetic protein FliR
MEKGLFVFFLVFARAGGLFTVFPVFSGRYIPTQIKIALCAILSFITVPVIPAQIQYPSEILELIILIFKEYSAGLILGFICRLVFFALELAGHIISQEIGLNNANIIAPFTDSRTDMPAMILFYLGGIIFLCLDLHHWLIAGFQKSFLIMPLGKAHLSEATMIAIISKTNLIFRIAILLSAPVMVMSFLVTVVFSLLGRAIPQMNVFLESLVIRPLIGIAVLGLTLNLMAQHVLNFLRRLPEDMMQLARLLALG